MFLLCTIQIKISGTQKNLNSEKKNQVKKCQIDHLYKYFGENVVSKVWANIVHFTYELSLI